jgi:thioredoxin reductase (NADPH)
MSTPRHTKVLIIGSVTAGYTAAIYTARANLAPLLIQGLQPGGQLSITADVENYPGFAEAIQGPWLMDQMQAQAAHCGTLLLFDLVTEVDLETRPFVVRTDSGQVYTADTLIIATGAQARWLGLPGESHFSGAGVSACATCDGFFFRGKRVAIVGGGNTAVEEALYLAGMCEKVTLIHRRDTLRAEKVMQARLFKHPRVEVIWDTTVLEVLGTNAPKTVTGLRLRHVRTGEEYELPVDGLFVAIGHDPATGLFKGKLEMDREGYIVTGARSTATSVEGVYAAGDVQDKIYRQAVTAAGTGCMAALEAEKYIAALEAAEA